MTYYICQRNGQCKKPCNENCLYTNDFKKSKLFNMTVKPDNVDLIKDVNGNWWEIDWSWDNNLPDSMRKKPEEIIHVKYDYIAQIYISRLMLRHKLNG